MASFNVSILFETPPNLIVIFCIKNDLELKPFLGYLPNFKKIISIRINIYSIFINNLM